MTPPALRVDPVIAGRQSIRLHGVNSIAAQQHACITVEQLDAIEIGPTARKRLVARGVLVGERLGVYRIGGAPPDVWRPLAAACLALGRTVGASHWAACGLYSYPDVLPGAVEVTAFGRHSGDASGIRLHESARPDELRLVQGIPCTSPARAIADVAGRAGGAHLDLVGRIVDDARRRDLCSLDEIRQAAPPKMPKILRIVLDRREEGAIDLEGIYLRAIREAGLPTPVMQYQVVVGAKIYLIDFAWPWCKVGLEPKGWRVHGASRRGFDNDAEREGELTALGMAPHPGDHREPPRNRHPPRQQADHPVDPVNRANCWRDFTGSTPEGDRMGVWRATMRRTTPRAITTGSPKHGDCCWATTSTTACSRPTTSRWRRRPTRSLD